MLRMPGNKFFDRGDERRQRALHVRRATPVQHAVAHGWNERVAVPLICRPGRHHVGMPGEAHQRPGVAAPRPQIVHLAAAHFFQAETERRKARTDDVQAAVIRRREGAARDELLGELQCFRHGVNGQFYLGSSRLSLMPLKSDCGFELAGAP